MRLGASDAARARSLRALTLGSMTLQGPHQVVAKSITTRVSFKSLTAESNAFSEPRSFIALRATLRGVGDLRASTLQARRVQ